jgi:hypothetical protein
MQGQVGDGLEARQLDAGLRREFLDVPELAIELDDPAKADLIGARHVLHM